ncbi:sigma factor [Streptosporangium subroseum]|uniref:RNA polymerase sigma factor n=1 Tax=Streptosporangium subroseum TaxID=106412 RepID=UPI00343A8A4D
MYGHAFRLTGNWSAAEDVMSLTFLEAWRLRHRIDADGGSLRPWLLGIATNVARNTRRAARRYDDALTRMPRAEQVPITINEAKDPKSLQADLRDMGLNAVVDYIPKGKKCSPQPRSQSFLSKEEAPLPVWPTPESQEPGFTIDPKVVKDGQTAVLEFSVSEQPEKTVAGIWASVSNGPVADCELVDSTEAPLGPPQDN